MTAFSYTFRVDASRMATQFVARASDLSPAMRLIAGYLVSSTLQRFATGVGPDGQAWPPPLHRDGQALRDTDKLMGSIHGESTATEASAATDATQARMMQHGTAGLPGGVLRPKTAKALTVPLTAAARQRPARLWPDLFVWRKAAYEGISGGGAFLARRVGTGKNAKLELVFALRASVTIPARPFMGINEYDQGRVTDILARWLTRGAA